MPVLDGYKLAQKIRQFEKNNKLERVPIVAVTACSNQEVKTKSVNAGMNAVFAKPIKFEHIHEIVHRYMFNQNLQEYKNLFREHFKKEYDNL